MDDPNSPNDDQADQPIDDLDEGAVRIHEEAIHHITKTILGSPGLFMVASKHYYDQCNPDHVSVFNANVCIDGPPRKIWYGDLDLTLDEKRLAVLAKALDQTIFILEERDTRFHGRDENPPLGGCPKGRARR